MGVLINDIRHLMPRAENPPEGLYPTRLESAINKVVVHHSLTLSGSAIAYANHHISHNGWETIAYHFVIDLDGTINYTLPLTKKGWHGNSANYSSVGICLTGNFDINEPTASQLDALVNLILYLEEYLGRQLKIDPHNKYNPSKTCPGDNFNLEEIRNRVRNFPSPPTILTPGATSNLIAAGTILLLLWWKKS